MSEPDPERERKLAELPLYDRLLHGIGRVAQAQVFVDVALRTLHMELTQLVTAKFPPGLGPRNMWRLIDKCRDLLASAPLPDNLKVAGEGALNEVLAVDERRDRVIHDWWRHGADDPSGMPYQRQRTAEWKAEPSDLGYVDEVEESFIHVQYRIQALYSVVSNNRYIAAQGAEWQFVPDHELAMIRGEFDLLPDGGYRMHGASGTP